MSTNDPSTSQDQNQISQLYQTGATEVPSHLIDQRILQQAKAALPKLAQSSNSVQRISAKSWRKWQWSGSIAASVLLVSWLFMFNQSNYQNIDLLDEEQYTESVIAAKKETEVVVKRRRLQTDQKLQEIARIEKTVAEKVQGLSADHVEATPQSSSLVSEPPLAFAKEAKDILETETLTSDLALSANVPKKLPTDNSVEADSSIAKKTVQSSPDYQYLDSLLQNLLFYRQKLELNNNNLKLEKPVSSDQAGARLQNKNSISAQNIQLELYEILLKHKQHDPTLLVPQKYLNVLSQEQREKLVTDTEVLEVEQINE